MTFFLIRKYLKNLLNQVKFCNGSSEIEGGYGITESMLSVAFVLASCANERPAITVRAESMKDKLRRLYKNHKAYSYKEARKIMYNQADCTNGKMYLVYGGKQYNWKCGGTSMPSSTEVNAEHTVPQSFFNSKSPMVSDLHHLFSAPAKLNNRRSNYPFKEMDYSKCKEFCRDNSCTTSRPSNPDDYSCFGEDGKSWMPIKQDRGQVARAVLYYFTMYDGVDISRVGDVNTFLKWNREFPPSDREKARNNIVNQTQGNRNPYIDDYTLADQVFAK